MFAAINAAAPWQLGGSKSALRADLRQAFGISFEREAFLDQLLAQIVPHERIIGMIGSAGHLIGKPDILIAPENSQK